MGKKMSEVMLQHMLKGRTSTQRERWHAILEGRLLSQTPSLLRSGIDESIERIDRLCESQIEKLLAVMFQELTRNSWIGKPRAFEFGEFAYDTHHSWLESMTNSFNGMAQKYWIGVIAPQCEWRRYRVDFMFSAMLRDNRGDPQFQSLAVECDGHAFHERTRDQAEHDRARDRELVSAGIHVFRFTGSQINRSPADCAEEIMEFFNQWAAPFFAEDGQ